MGSGVAPSVSPSVDNYSLVKAQGTAGRIHVSSILFMVISKMDLFILLSAAYHISWNERSRRMQCSEVSMLIVPR